MIEYDITLPDGYQTKPLPGRDEWIAALRSGKYLQGTHALMRFNGTCCCLGVKCILDNRPVGIPTTPNLNPLGKSFDGIDNVLSDQNPVFPYLGSVGTFPQGVLVRIKREIAVLTDTHDRRHDLASCNDAGLTFSQIADIIARVWHNV